MSQIFEPLKDLGKYGKIGKPLGSGVYGAVYTYENNTTGKKYAVKVMQISDPVEGITSSMISDISTLKLLDHPHIVKAIYTIITDLLKNISAQYTISQKFYQDIYWEFLAKRGCNAKAGTTQIPLGRGS